jgi:alpha-tubulin suppressor-like RCC1 family protein
MIKTRRFIGMSGLVLLGLVIVGVGSAFGANQSGGRTEAAGAGTLSAEASLANDGAGYCALSTLGGVDCWGYGNDGELGDGHFLGDGVSDGRAVPVQVEGVGGTGTLSGVASLTAGVESYCAMLTSGGVDCWGTGTFGQLGDGVFYTTGEHGTRGSAVPVQVKGVGGTGTLSGVASLTTTDSDSAGYCVLLTSGGVDCWGLGSSGELGDGQSYTIGSAVPVQVENVGYSGTLSGVASLTGGASTCALLTSGGVDCWGGGTGIPVPVEGVGGAGTLGGVASLANDGTSFCALLTSGGVDCWGDGPQGQLGDGKFYPNGYDGSAVPVQVVEGAGSIGPLSGVASVAAGENGYCALLTSGGVDCWGDGQNGQLGDGVLYTTWPDGSAVPVQVEGVGGSGSLSRVASLASNGINCAVLTSGRVDCWGYGAQGQMGDGQFYTTFPDGSAVPVQVEGVGGSGTLSRVASLTGGASDCALLTSGGVDCWGSGQWGQLGDGQFYKTGNGGSAVPVKVK